MSEGGCFLGNEHSAQVEAEVSGGMAAIGRAHAPTRRVMAANEALSLGFGGISEVHCACGLSRRAIAQGIREIREGVGSARGWAHSSPRGGAQIHHSLRPAPVGGAGRDD